MPEILNLMPHHKCLALVVGHSLRGENFGTGGYTWRFSDEMLPRGYTATAVGSGRAIVKWGYVPAELLADLENFFETGQLPGSELWEDLPERGEMVFYMGDGYVAHGYLNPNGTVAEW
jgi:hypothetical protein